MLESFSIFIEQHIQYAPFIIFGLLLLAGFNLPVSEDLMLFISANLAAGYPKHTIPLFLGVYVGAYVSDIIAFTLGKYFGPIILAPIPPPDLSKKDEIKKKLSSHPLIGPIWANGWVAVIFFFYEIKIFLKSLLIRVFAQKRTDQVRTYMHQYGIITLVIGRFIPFGVRNVLFITCGISKVSYPKFLMADFVACTISNLFFFKLYYHLGPPVITYVKKFNIIIFIVFMIILTAIVLMKYLQKKPNCSV